VFEIFAAQSRAAINATTETAMTTVAQHGATPSDLKPNVYRTASETAAAQNPAGGPNAPSVYQNKASQPEGQKP